METLAQIMAEAEIIVNLADFPVRVQELMQTRFDELDEHFEVDGMGMDVMFYGKESIKVMVDIELDSQKKKEKFVKHMQQMAHATQAEYYCMAVEGKIQATQEDIMQIMVEDKDWLYTAMSAVDSQGKLTQWYFDKRKPSKEELMTGILCQSEVDDQGFFNPIRVTTTSMQQLRKHLASGNKDYVKIMYMPNSQDVGGVTTVTCSAKFKETVANDPDFAEHMKESTEFLKDNDEGATLYIGFDEDSHEIFEIRQFVKDKLTQQFVNHKKNKKGVLLYRFKKGKWQFVSNKASMGLKVEVEKLLPFIE